MPRSSSSTLLLPFRPRCAHTWTDIEQNFAYGPQLNLLTPWWSSNMKRASGWWERGWWCFRFSPFRLLITHGMECMDVKDGCMDGCKVWMYEWMDGGMEGFREEEESSGAIFVFFLSWSSFLVLAANTCSRPTDGPCRNFVLPIFVTFCFLRVKVCIEVRSRDWKEIFGWICNGNG